MENHKELMLDQERDAGLIAALLSLTQSSAAEHFSVFDLEARCELLEGYWAEFQKRDYILQRGKDQLRELPYFKSGTYGAALSNYLTAKSWFRQNIQAASGAREHRESSNVQRNEVVSTQASLEKMKLPTFDGNHREWEHFKDKFTALIVNDSKMDPIVKMQHLNNCLGSEPAEKLKTIKFSGANFLTAWQALRTRYDNNYLRFSVQMEALMKLPPSATETVTHLSQLINTVDDSINTFTALGRPVQHWDDIFVYFVESKMAESTRRDWIKELTALKAQDGFGKYSEIKKFIEGRLHDLDIMEARVNAATPVESGSCDRESKGEAVNGGRKPFKPKGSKSTGVHVSTQQSSKQPSKTICSFCKGEHFLGFCKKFAACSQAQRRAHAMSAKLCFNCLNAHHSVDACQSKGRCLVCGSRHHTKLHQDVSTVSNASATVSESTDTTEQQDSFAAHVSSEQKRQQVQGTSVTSNRKVLLATACVLLQGPDGQTMTARALLDSGAEESFVTEQVVQTLSLKKNSTNVVVSGVGGSATAVARNRVSVILKSRQEPNFTFNVSALVLRRLSAMIPSSEILTKSWPHLTGLQLADLHHDTPSRIDCILNSEVYAAVLLSGIKRGPPGMPTALNTVFGWVLMGAAQSGEQSSSTRANHVAVHHELTQAVARFWEVEDAPSQPILTPSEQECYNHFRRTHVRNEEGRFVVRLPFIKPPMPLKTRGIAEACLRRLDQRFLQHPELGKLYQAFLKEYLDLGHMEVMPDSEVSLSDTYYMPHHPVFKKDDDKIRVVFNASQKNAQGISLNSLLHVGPKLQEEVCIIMIQWAFHPVVFKCDVKKMFRQYLVDKRDADWQRILIHESPTAQVVTCRLLTVTYGTSPAPFIANACMIQLAEDEKETHPEGAEVLINGRYVDDLFAGGDTLEEAAHVQEDLVGILSTAGMQVGKWAANRAELLANLENSAPEDIGAVFEDKNAVSTLGLRWLATEDVFCFKISQPNEREAITKRSMLSEISKLYDPMGWLSPVIVTAKILLQNLWLQGVEWDHPVSDDLKRTWTTFREQLVDVERIKIPRWYGSYRNSSWDLHCFCDASERAYATALYAVVQREDKIVLAWLQSHPSRWKSFVANRVSEIVTALPDVVWGHVRSADNPADLATRGLTPTLLKDSVIWWEGPAWLQQPPTMWPSNPSEEIQTNEEERRGVFVTVAEEVAEFANWLTAHSSFDKLIRILAYIYRWKTNAKLGLQERRLTWLSAQELAAGRTFLVRLVQREVYSAEIAELRHKETVKNSSALYRLAPFLDVEGVLRVGGRLQNAFLSEEEKHPIILPSKHHVVRLLIAKAHKVTLHGGPTLVQSHLARQYWIIRGRNTIRREVRKCVLCARHRAIAIEQRMGPLPAVRTRPARAFTLTGVDFAGPFPIRCSAGRGQKTFKGYVAIFICLVIRAVHIELVSDLTSAAFLAAFRRFTSRRGMCKVVYSDNAKSFRGADAELKHLFNQTSAMSQEIAAVLARDQVEWNYIPPRAPNFGGLWEVSVRSFKGHLKKVIGELKLTFEEFYTVCSTIEACLNSRPLSLLSSSEEDVAALTPGHFLIGAPLTAPPEPFVDTNENHSLASRWQLLTRIRNHFWKRWYGEFLSQAQERSKWLHPNRSFQVGDVVLFKDELMPPTKWPLARIIRLYAGKDGLSRVATIKTASSEYKRPINKLILLPVNEEASNHLIQLRIPVEMKAGASVVY